MSWHEGLSEEYRGNESLSQIPDLDTMAKGFLDAQAYAGGAIRIPGEGAGEEDWSAFNAKLTEQVPTLLNLPSDEAEATAALYARLGRPENADGYSVAAQASPEQKEWLSWAFEQGMSDSQVKNWLDKNGENATAGQDAYEAQITELEAALKGEWGHAYDQKLADSNNALLAYGDDGVTDFLEQTGLKDHPMMKRLLAKAGANLTEDQTKGKGGGNQFALAPAEALERINEIQRNREHPYHNKRHPQHGDAVKSMEKFFSQAYPEDS